MSRRTTLALVAGILTAGLCLSAAGVAWLGEASPSVNGNPLTAPGISLGLQRFTGSVEEELAAGSYTYFRVRTADLRDRWVVVLGAADRGAQMLDVKSYGVREGFGSKRLGRHFDRLHFATVSQPGESR